MRYFKEISKRKDVTFFTGHNYYRVYPDGRFDYFNYAYRNWTRMKEGFSPGEDASRELCVDSLWIEYMDEFKDAWEFVELTKEELFMELL